MLCEDVLLWSLDLSEDCNRARSIQLTPITSSFSKAHFNIISQLDHLRLVIQVIPIKLYKHFLIPSSY